MSNDAAGFTRVTDRSVASPNGAFDAGLRPDPFPDRAASLLPGLLAATRTGLSPAGDDELAWIGSPQTITSNYWAHSRLVVPARVEGCLSRPLRSASRRRARSYGRGCG